MNIYNARMISFLLLMFSMRLCMINSLLIVCFYNGFLKNKIGRYFTKIHGKTVRNGYNSTFMEY